MMLFLRTADIMVKWWTFDKMDIRDSYGDRINFV